MATDIKKLQARLERLRNEQSSYRQTWQELAEIFLPRRGSHLFGGGRDTTRGRRRDRKVINSTTIEAARTLAQGMHAGMTNPSTPWFRNTVEGKMSSHRVKMFCEKLDALQRRILRASNVYRVLPVMYRELGIFGPSAAFVRRNLRPEGRFSPRLGDIIHLTHMPIGTWCAATDEYGRPNTLYREFDMTVGQMVSDFGRDKVSQAVANLFDRGALDEFVRVVHVIEPRASRNGYSRFQSEMPFSSCFFEYGCHEDKRLADEGFRRFPVLIPRWDVDSDEVYGFGCGWEAIGDGNGLQHAELRKAQVIDHKTNPPLQVPTSLKNGGADTLPGGISYYDGTGPNSGIRTAFEVQLDVSELREDRQDIEMRVSRAFYVDLFRHILDDTRSNITAREIAERHAEKMLLLGPVVGRVENELLMPLIDMTFDAIVEADEDREAVGLEPLLPDVPPELEEGEEITFEFESMLSQALKMSEAAALDRFTGTFASLYTIKQDLVDKVDLDEIVDQYQERLGVPASVVRDDDTVVELREARARTMQAAQAAEAAKTASEATKNVAAAQASMPAAPPTDIAGALSTAQTLSPGA